MTIPNIKGIIRKWSIIPNIYLRNRENMYEILQTEKFAIIFSFMIGAAVVAMGSPLCKGEECYIKKAPSIAEMKKNTYSIGNKCYQFKSEIVACPAKGVIEAFVSI